MDSSGFGDQDSGWATGGGSSGTDGEWQ